MAGFPSSWISQSIAAQNASFAQNNYLAQQMSVPVPGMMGPGGQQVAPPPPPVMAPPPPSAMTAANHYRADRGGMMGESIAAGMASFGSNIAMPIAGGALALAGLDPFSLSLKAGMGGFSALGGGAAGLVGGAAAATGVALPLYAGYKLAQTYGGAFTGGMRDQTALNATLRNNFQFIGGARGQGFTQRQMGSIGGVVQNELDRNLYTSANELNSLIAQGAQGGMFTGVRDVGEFSRKFRNMLDTLKSVQKELGGSLQEAMNFVQEAKNSGIFNRLDRQNLATQVREVTQMTGMRREDAMLLAAQGAQIARQTGGTGAQGAFGALRTAQGLGTALSTGAINEGMLSNATGGLTGTAAIQAFSQRMMQHTARFSRRAMGRYSLFALADPRNMGQLDRGALAQFMAGDITVGDVSRRAHRNVNQMGRAQAINREGELRGALLEQGGMAAQIGMMRLMLGDRVMNQGDDFSQLVMRRRFGMSRQEAEIMQNLIRNQSTIAQQEIADRGASARSARREEVRRDRSFGAIMDRIGHEIEHGLGVHEIRQMGRNFVTKLSAAGQRAMDRMLGIYTEEMSSSMQSSFDRVFSGRGRESDLQRLELLNSIGGTQSGGFTFDPFQQGMMPGLAGMESIGERLEGMGYNISGFGAGRAGRRFREAVGGTARGAAHQLSRAEMTQRTLSALAEVDAARAGVVTGGHRDALQAMERNTPLTNRRLRRAMIEARGGGRAADFLGVLEESGMDRSAAIAYMVRHGMADPVGDGLDLSQVDASTGAGIFGMRDPGRQRSWVDNAIFGSGVGRVLEDLNLLGTTRRERALNFVSEGGHTARETLRQSELARRSGRTRTVGGRRMNAVQRQQYFRRMAEGLKVDTEALDALTQEQEVQNLILRMGHGGPSARAALAELESLSLSEGPDSARGAALRSLVTQAEDSMRRDRERGGSGRVDRSLLSLALTPEAEQDARAAVQQRAELARHFAGAAAMLEEAGMAATANALSTAAEATRAGDARGVNEALRGEIHRIARLSPEERQQALRGLGQVASQEGKENLQSVVAAAAAEGQLRDSLMGRGRGSRRSRRQSVETAMQALGGMGLGREFRIEGPNGRMITGSRAQRILERTLRGGRGVPEELRTAALEAFRRQGREAGLSGDALEEIESAVTAVARAGTEEERSAATERVVQLRERYGDQFAEVEKRRAEQALAAAGRQDPLGQRRNELLQKIAENTAKPSDNEAPAATSGGDGG